MQKKELLPDGVITLSSSPELQIEGQQDSLLELLEQKKSEFKIVDVIVDGEKFAGGVTRYKFITENQDTWVIIVDPKIHNNDLIHNSPDGFVSKLSLRQHLQDLNLNFKLEEEPDLKRKKDMEPQINHSRNIFFLAANWELLAQRVFNLRGDKLSFFSLLEVNLAANEDIGERQIDFIGIALSPDHISIFVVEVGTSKTHKKSKKLEEYLNAINCYLDSDYKITPIIAKYSFLGGATKLVFKPPGTPDPKL